MTVAVVIRMDNIKLTSPSSILWPKCSQEIREIVFVDGKRWCAGGDVFRAGDFIELFVFIPSSSDALGYQLRIIPVERRCCGAS